MDNPEARTPHPFETLWSNLSREERDICGEMFRQHLLGLLAPELLEVATSYWDTHWTVLPLQDKHDQAEQIGHLTGQMLNKLLTHHAVERGKSGKFVLDYYQYIAEHPPMNEAAGWVKKMFDDKASKHNQPRLKYVDAYRCTEEFGTFISAKVSLPPSAFSNS